MLVDHSISPHCIVVCSPVSPTELRKLGRCPLTPEEAALVLSGLGFKRGTYIYLAGSHIYGEKSRMDYFTNLYPNLVTKETILTPHELAPFRNFSSQVKKLFFSEKDLFTDMNMQYENSLLKFLEDFKTVTYSARVKV